MNLKKKKKKKPDKPWAKLTKNKKEESNKQNCNWNITVDTTEIWRVIREYYEQLYAINLTT